MYYIELNSINWALKFLALPPSPQPLTPPSNVSYRSAYAHKFFIMSAIGFFVIFALIVVKFHY